ncbi:molecular chaperone HtpG [Helicobacter mustelae]|uniref:Chaperone protein HtpG n=1 Tax=Helicobacter mustelae (strain ATCC 43772 / CCUG 25715 / CIP 103759 / LMG 18044 / NCTC 12198 / R85-136P) TaxID=679897 RepID=D3UH07_HELM1|nr:molecular chaperone HtpG [Helicobacter mustelae]CBG39779.1 hsp90 family heat shock protein [Helicobacter mustelae 12198]SQH71289.1 hsp90 family heat shock protein [Helicobacter mustelae]
MSNKHSFQTEINQLLDLMIHSLYSNKEIFLRELISNASDALDKLNYLTLTDEKLKSLAFDPRIDIEFDSQKKTLSISDNGIGMDEEDLKSHLGTIAKSGTKSFLNNLSGDKKKDHALIGQFGVGFYSAFMVAEKVIVQTKKAGDKEAFAWISDGKGEYEITSCTKEKQGTQITLYFKEEDKNFASRWEIENIVKKYSEHIQFPIFLHYQESKFEGEGDKKKEIKEDKIEQINTAKAIWKTPKSDLKDEDYKEFYKGFAHDNSEPLKWIHTKVEGNLEYTTLFFIPQKAPFDLYRVDYKSGIKLYVKRVFITDDDKELLPQYLRFIRGIIDSEDLPLNVSREILQQNKILANIKSASTKKILSEIANLSKDEKVYKEFYANFGKVLKEGLYHDFENKDKILDLLLFASNTQESLQSLKKYKEAMPKEQKSIYYLLGENLDLLKASPILEKYNKKGFSVLLLSDEVDSFVMPNISEYDKTPLKDAASKQALEELGSEEIEENTKKEFENLCTIAKEVLGEQVKEIRLSNTLNSPVALIGEEENAMMANLMRQMGQSVPEPQKILELNIHHPIIQKLKTRDKQAIQENMILLLDSAKLLESGQIKDAKNFTQKIFQLIEQGL